MVNLVAILKILFDKFYLFGFLMFGSFFQFLYLIVASRGYVNLNLFLKFYLLVQLFLPQYMVPYRKTCLFVPQTLVLFLSTIF